jgi:hypothetical protein
MVGRCYGDEREERVRATLRDVRFHVRCTVTHGMNRALHVIFSPCTEPVTYGAT